ncbi:MULTISPECIES: hypothetical protein [Pseudomonas]|uniref:hypothetical protein n=1 Tax=Pseudomonas TaxID=286 RepID=UPI00387B5252
MKHTAQKHLMCLTILAMLSGSSLADPHNDGLTLGKSQLNKLSSNVNAANGKNVPNYNDNPPQAGQFGGSSLFTVGAARINTCKTEQPGSDKVKNQECDAVNFLAKNPEERVKVPIGGNDPIFDGIGDIINNAKPGVVTEVCQTKTTTTPNIYETEVCNEFNLSNDKSCTMGQIVEVDAKSNYQCNVTKNAVETLSCDNVLVVQCSTPVDGCDNGGIVPGTTQGDMYTTWGPAGNGNYALQFGVIGDNYWSGGSGAVFDRSLQFQIKDLSTVTQFMLSNVWYDDYFMVRVNGNLVFNGPFGGSTLTLGSQMCGTAREGRYPCPKVSVGNGALYTPELGTSQAGAPGVDLRPYLVNGVNTVTTRTIVGGGGESALSIQARMMCPGSCTFSWDNKCASLEARAR